MSASATVRVVLEAQQPGNSVSIRSMCPSDTIVHFSPADPHPSRSRPFARRGSHARCHRTRVLCQLRGMFHQEKNRALSSWTASRMTATTATTPFNTGNNHHHTTSRMTQHWSQSSPRLHVTIQYSMHTSLAGDQGSQGETHPLGRAGRRSASTGLRQGDASPSLRGDGSQSRWAGTEAH